MSGTADDALWKRRSDTNLEKRLKSLLTCVTAVSAVPGSSGRPARATRPWHTGSSSLSGRCLEDTMETFGVFLLGSKRVCESCSVCCTDLPIPADTVGLYRKPAGIACTHLCATGCRIYSRRPRLCADFRCAWLRDRNWPEGWRPDRSGLMCLREEIEAEFLAAAVYEIRPGALQGSAADEIMAALRLSAAVVAVVGIGERRRRQLSERLLHAAEPLPAKPHFLGRGSPQPDLPSHRAAPDSY